MSLDIKRYKQKKILGEGDGSKIFLVFNEGENKYYALKEIIIKDKQKEEINNIETEAKILSEFNSKNIVKYYASSIINNNFYILMEYIEGQNLKEFIEKYEDEHPGELIQETILYKIIAQICNAIKLIHSKNIVHRDLKLENIIININYEIKIIDFGISKHFNFKKKSTKTKNKAGTTNYMAPEIFRGIYNQKADIYALGCIFYKLFISDNPDYFIDKMRNEVQKISQDYNPNWQILMDLLLHNDFDKRPDINQVIDFINTNLLNIKEKALLTDFNKQYRCHLIDTSVEKIYLNYVFTENEMMNLLNEVSFANLKELSLIGNGISNINVLKNIKLNNLELLNLFCNEITDIKILKDVKFDNLKILNLGHNHISDINVLENVNFNKLKELNLSWNKIDDINALKYNEFKELIILNLSQNEISDINILEYIKFNKLEILDLSYNKISNTNILEYLNFPKLKQLSLNNNKIKANDILNNIRNIPIFDHIIFEKIKNQQFVSFENLEFLYEMISKIDNIFQFDTILDFINIKIIKLKSGDKGQEYFFLLARKFEFLAKGEINSLKDEELEKVIYLSEKLIKIIYKGLFYLY